ncbi:hypothetical protein Tco_1045937 [Tanacetum coccineum]
MVCTKFRVNTLNVGYAVGGSSRGAGIDDEDMDDVFAVFAGMTCVDVSGGYYIQVRRELDSPILKFVIQHMAKERICKNHKKTVKNQQTRIRDGKECARAGSFYTRSKHTLISKKGAGKLVVTVHRLQQFTKGLNQRAFTNLRTKRTIQGLKYMLAEYGVIPYTLLARPTKGMPRWYEENTREMEICAKISAKEAHMV